MTGRQITQLAPPSPLLGPEGEQCAECGAVLAADQRYCINCGRRRATPRVDHRALLTPGSGPASTTSGAPPQLPAVESGRALSPLGAAAAAGLLLLAVLVGAVLGSSSADDKATAPIVSAAPGSAAQAAVPAAFTSDWETGGGWTVRLQSFDKAATQPAQVQAAEKAATDKGARDVGSLDSDEYPSLGAGQYVLFSGRFDSARRARAALKGLRASFPGAAVVEVSAQSPAAKATAGADGAAGSTAEADPAAQKQLEDLTKSSPEEYQKKSRKLPDEVSTGGKQVPKDKQAPRGADQGGTTIE